LAILGAGLAITASAPVFATSTGLNNIPTADTPGDRELVFQSFVNIRDERHDDYFLGFKGGLRPWKVRFEYGADGRIGEGTSQPAVLQFKFAVALSELFEYEQELPMVAVGVVNLGLTSDDRDEVGQPATFPVVTQDFGWFRAHAGYLFQHNNNAAFFGFDKTIELFERDLMLRTDFIQIEDGAQWLGSAGFIYFIHEHFALESWASIPFEHGEPTFTLKMNVIFSF
jgi:hypothetical protein